MIDYFGKGAFKVTKRIRDLSFTRVKELADFSYLQNGSNQLTAKLLFHGALADRFDYQLLLGFANFHTEKESGIAMIYYYYLYLQKDEFDEDFRRHFMVMLSDAMNQYGLAKPKIFKEVLTLGDIFDYEGFVFNITELERHADSAIKQMGSLKNVILVSENMLGWKVGFINPNTYKDYSDYASPNVSITKEYEQWLDGYDNEIVVLDDLISNSKIIKKRRSPNA